MNGSVPLAQILFLLILLGVVFAAALRAPRVGATRFLLYVTAWSAVFLTTFVLYAYRFEFDNVRQRVLAEFLPNTPISHATAVTIRRNPSGHFVVNAAIHNVTLPVMIDTGATHIVLTPSDASRIGLNPDTLVYSDFAETAGGTIRVAPVLLKTVTIGSITRRNILAAVTTTAMDVSLLGMSFLNTLNSYTFDQTGLHLKS